VSWLEERTGLGEAVRSLKSRLSRPLPSGSAGAVLGSAAIFFLLVQAASGALLAIYYTPSWTEAHASVVRITKDVTFGWLVRSVHLWSAHLLVATAALHLVRTFARGSYSKPREVTWFTGVALLGLLMAAAFTGQMLPMDDEAVKGAEIGAAYANEVGMGDVVRGGTTVGGPTLTRMFSTHVLWVPAGLVLLVVSHLALVGRHRLHGAEALQGESPVFLKCLGLTVIGAAGLLATLAFAFPAGIGPAPNAAEAGAAAKPLWMFLPVYQAAKHVSGPATLLLLLGPMAFLIAIPVLPRRLAVGLGLLVLAGAIALGIMGAMA